MTLSGVAVQAVFILLLLVKRQWIELQYDTIVFFLFFFIMVKQRLPSIF